MTEHDHDEIARRLRETGTVRAPEQLRAEVMDQVRSEPRMRQSRRSFLIPALPYAAAAAAVLAAFVLAASHLGGGSGSAGSAASGGGAAGASSARAPEAVKDAAGGSKAVDRDTFSLPAAALQQLSHAPHVKTHTSQDAVIVAVPYARLEHYRQRLSAIEKRAQGADTVRVVLQPKR